jgi:hypothetical protein
MNYLIAVLVLVLIAVSIRESIYKHQLTDAIRELACSETRIVVECCDTKKPGPDGSYPPTVVPGLYFENEDSIADDMELVKEYRKQALRNPYRGLEVFDEE